MYTKNLPVFREVRNGGLPAVLDDFFADFDRLFRELPGGSFRARGGGALAMDVAESPEAFIVTVNVPGVRKDQVALEVESGKLAISIAESKEQESGDVKYHYRGRAPISLKRELKLPSSISEVDAELKDGVLTITLKKDDSEKPRKITVK